MARTTGVNTRLVKKISGAKPIRLSVALPVVVVSSGQGSSGGGER